MLAINQGWEPCKHSWVYCYTDELLELTKGSIDWTAAKARKAKPTSFQLITKYKQKNPWLEMLHISAFITVMPVRQVPVLRTPCALFPLEVAIVAGKIIRHVCTLPRGPEVHSSKAIPENTEVLMTVEKCFPPISLGSLLSRGPTQAFLWFSPGVCLTIDNPVWLLHCTSPNLFT